MPDDKGILTGIKKLLIDNLLISIPGQGMEVYKYEADKYAPMIESLVLDNLAGVTDEELASKSSIILRDRLAGKTTPINPKAYEDDAEAIISLILPILSARHQKELQEAVEQARNEIHELRLQYASRLKSAVEQAHIEERKAIGKWLEDNSRLFLGSFDAGDNFEAITAKLQRGEPPHGEQPKEAEK